MESNVEQCAFLASQKAIQSKKELPLSVINGESCQKKTRVNELKLLAMTAQQELDKMWRRKYPEQFKDYPCN